MHTAFLHIQTGGTTLVNATSLFSLDTETEFMTKLWTNQESKKIGMSQKVISDILLWVCVHKLLENNLWELKHFALNVGVPVYILQTGQ